MRKTLFNILEIIVITGKLEKYYSIDLNRKVPKADMKSTKQDKMPGFRFSWKYDKEVTLWAKYKERNKQFIR